jgi:hypothetical protein
MDKSDNQSKFSENDNNSDIDLSPCNEPEKSGANTENNIVVVEEIDKSKSKKINKKKSIII